MKRVIVLTTALLLFLSATVASAVIYQLPAYGTNNSSPPVLTITLGSRPLKISASGLVKTNPGGWNGVTVDDQNPAAYTPRAGDTFTILTSKKLVAEFDSFQVVGLPSPYYLKKTLRSNQVILTVMKSAQ
jgi:hypothetical protein